MTFDPSVDRPHVAVIGGGFAGAAAATALTEMGMTVTLLEERATLGGRANSLRDGVTKDEIDNGQHLFMGCYQETRRFLKRLGVDNRLRFESALALNFYSLTGRSVLKPRFFPGALGMVLGLFRHRELSFRDVSGILRGLGTLMLDHQDITSMTVSQWLTENHQTTGSRRAFWDPLCLSTLNETALKASAAALSVVVRKGLMSSTNDRALGYATLGLSKLWALEIPTYLRRQSGVVATRQEVTGFDVQEGRVKRAWVAGGRAIEADAFVCAVPIGIFRRIAPFPLNNAMSGLENAEHSPILSVHLWFTRAPFEEPFVGFLDMDVQWVFHRHRLWGEGRARPGTLSCVLSAAREHRKKTRDELVAMVVKDIRRAFPDFGEEPSHAAVVWEMQATPSVSPAFWKARPPVETSLKNFFLAGDWVDTGFPPTIEAAVNSGHRAAVLVKKYLEDGRRQTLETKEATTC